MLNTCASESSGELERGRSAAVKAPPRHCLGGGRAGGRGGGVGRKRRERERRASDLYGARERCASDLYGARERCASESYRMEGRGGGRGRASRIHSPIGDSCVSSSSNLPAAPPASISLTGFDQSRGAAGRGQREPARGGSEGRRATSEAGGPGPGGGRGRRAPHEERGALVGVLVVVLPAGAARVSLTSFDQPRGPTAPL